MSDWDAVIVGGGPAGLTAGLYLGRGNLRTVVLEKENIGGYIMNVEMVENYPGFAEGVIGSQLAMEMKNQAKKYGVKLERAEVTGIQSTSNKKWVACIDGNNYSAKAVILAGGSIPKKLGVPGEEEFRGKGVFSCAFCDGGDFIDRVVAVCGGGDAGITEALYLTRLASRVILIEALPRLTATAVLQDRAKADPKLVIRCGEKVTAIVGSDRVEGIQVVKDREQTETVKVDGVLVHVGLNPNTDYLGGTVPLDSQRQVIVNEWMETKVPGIFAAGDIRSNSPRQVATAVGDGAVAGMAALRFLQGQQNH
jgi:thioredoxin reductase (NADPH)